MGKVEGRGGGEKGETVTGKGREREEKTHDRAKGENLTMFLGLVWYTVHTQEKLTTGPWNVQYTIHPF